MTRPLVLIFWLVVSVSPAAVFHSNVPAAAQWPQAGVDGKMPFHSYVGKGGKRIDTCVLAHGHGFTQEALSYVGAAGLANLIVGSKFEVVRTFGHLYFGRYFIEGLLDKACNRVIVVMQESSESTILEMTLRLERFLAAHACMAPTDPRTTVGCALMGHSKAGAASVALLRRCAEARPPGRSGLPLPAFGSDLGPSGCAQLGEVYSSAGVVEGVILPILLAGARKLPESNPARAMERLLGLDLFGDKKNGSNPTWFDLGPLAEMDSLDGGPTAVPIALRHGGEFRLERKGFLKQIDFAAGAGLFSDDPAPEDRPLSTLGFSWNPMVLARVALMYARLNTAEVLEKGKEQLSQTARLRGLTDEKGSLAFLDRYQIVEPARGAAPEPTIALENSDGLVEEASALDLCRRSREMPEKNRITRDCKVFTEVNHVGMSGLVEEVADHIITQFTDSGEPVRVREF